MNDHEREEKEKFLHVIVQFLNTPLQFRKPEDITELQKYTKDMEFFKDLINKGDSIAHRQCCQYMKHEFHRQHKKIFDIGELGDKFYIILSGKVGVYVRNINSTLDVLHGQDNKLLKFQKFTYGNGNNQVLQNNEGFHCVKELKEGEYFGEMALIKEGGTRSARIITHEDCHFAVLGDAAYKEILLKRQEAMILKKMQFFTTVDVFKDWSFKQLKDLHLNFEQIIYVKGDRIIKEGEKASWIYLIVDGEFTISQRLQSADPKSRQKVQDETLGGRLIKRESKKMLKLWRAVPKEFLGEEDVFLGNETYSYTAECETHQGVLYRFDVDTFFRCLLDDPRTLSQIQKIVEEKQELRNLKRSVLQDKLSKQYGSYLFHQKIETPQILKKSSQTQSNQFLKSAHSQSQYEAFTNDEGDEIITARSLREKWRKLDLADGNDYNTHASPKKVFHTVLGESFQQKLKRQYELRFKSRDLSGLKQHMEQEIIQTIDEKDWDVSPYKLKKKKETQDSLLGLQQKIIGHQQLDKNEQLYDGNQFDEQNPKYNFKKLLKTIHNKLTQPKTQANFRSTYTTNLQLRSDNYLPTESTMSQQPTSVRSLYVDKKQLELEYKAKQKNYEKLYQRDRRLAAYSQNDQQVILQQMGRSAEFLTPQKVKNTNNIIQFSTSQPDDIDQYSTARSTSNLKPPKRTVVAINLGVETKSGVIEQIQLVKINDHKNYLDSLGDNEDPANLKNMVIARRPFKKQPHFSPPKIKYKSSSQYVLDTIEKQISSHQQSQFLSPSPLSPLKIRSLKNLH